MMVNYVNEREGQIEFYKTILPLVDPSIVVDDILADDNDGVLNGNLLEFKLRVNDLNTVLLQTIKYLSARRIKGKPVPANILIVDLCAGVAYLYYSADYLADIEKVYYGGASKSNVGFMGKPYAEKYDYSDPLGAAGLIKTLKEKNWTRTHIDENCIVGWAEVYYRVKPTARKEDFIGDDTGKHKTIGEIRRPTVFKDYLIPYTGASNVKFQYLMDKLNDTLQKKNLGAFYTPEAYAEKSHELLRMAIARVPVGNDYVILDRCAGTGNLEKTLTDDELSHCILSTVEYYEYKVLQELLGSKVRHIIPPLEADDTFNAGLVQGADALSKEYVENPLIMQYVEDPRCTIILFENPPYADTTSVEHQRKGKGGSSTVWKQSWVVQEMKKEVRGTALNDMGNVFIWSGFKYYLRQPTDSYVVYSPVKYWKAQHMIDRRFIAGFGFNRRWFHTNIDAFISVVLWSQEVDNIDSFSVEGFDLTSEQGQLVPAGQIPVRRIHKTYSRTYFDKRTFSDDKNDGILCEANGLERHGGKTRRCTPVWNDNCLGYMVVYTSGFDNPDLHSYLLASGKYDGNGFYMRTDNYLSKLPMFCASRYITYNRGWTERARIMKSGDGAVEYNAAVDAGKLDQWLLKCLLFTCLEPQNHMRTFTGSDGRFYRNELCLDTTNGETVASCALENLDVSDDEKKLLDQWGILLAAAKKTSEYDSSLTYGVYQIFKEIDTSYKDDEGRIVWNNPSVHAALQTLKVLVRDYYNAQVVPTLFEYQFLK